MHSKRFHLAEETLELCLKNFALASTSCALLPIMPHYANSDQKWKHDNKNCWWQQKNQDPQRGISPEQTLQPQPTFASHHQQHNWKQTNSQPNCMIMQWALPHNWCNKKHKKETSSISLWDIFHYLTDTRNGSVLCSMGNQYCVVFTPANMHMIGLTSYLRQIKTFGSIYSAPPLVWY